MGRQSDMLVGSCEGNVVVDVVSLGGDVVDLKMHDVVETVVRANSMEIALSLAVIWL